MKTLEIKLPDEVFGVLSTIAKKKDKFVVDAIKEKIAREENKEDDFVENLNGGLGDELRPYGLSKGEFVVPEGFDEALPEEVLAGFEGE